jgi:hypothetical protein
MVMDNRSITSTIHHHLSSSCYCLQFKHLINSTAIPYMQSTSPSSQLHPTTSSFPQLDSSHLPNAYILARSRSSFRTASTLTKSLRGPGAVSWWKSLILSINSGIECRCCCFAMAFARVSQLCVYKRTVLATRTYI